MNVDIAYGIAAVSTSIDGEIGTLRVWKVWIALCRKIPFARRLSATGSLAPFRLTCRRRARTFNDYRGGDHLRMIRLIVD